MFSVCGDLIKFVKISKIYFMKKLWLFLACIGVVLSVRAAVPELVPDYMPLSALNTDKNTVKVVLGVVPDENNPDEVYIVRTEAAYDDSFEILTPDDAYLTLRPFDASDVQKDASDEWHWRYTDTFFSFQIPDAYGWRNVYVDYSGTGYTNKLTGCFYYNQTDGTFSLELEDKSMATKFKISLAENGMMTVRPQGAAGNIRVCKTSLDLTTSTAPLNFKFVPDCDDESDTWALYAFKKGNVARLKNAPVVTGENESINVTAEDGCKVMYYVESLSENGVEALAEEPWKDWSQGAWNDEYANTTLPAKLHLKSTYYDDNTGYTHESRPVEVELTSGEVTGIASVSKTDGSPAEYYNLQGVKVDASYKGFVIKVHAQGATKAIK